MPKHAGSREIPTKLAADSGSIILPATVLYLHGEEHDDAAPAEQRVRQPRLVQVGAQLPHRVDEAVRLEAQPQQPLELRHSDHHGVG